jgi:uncharacterized membrane protein
LEDLVRTLVTGLIVSIVFLAIAYAFWKRYDRPTEKMIEHQEGKAKMRHERKMWRAVEEQMSREQAAAEEEATSQRIMAEKKAMAQAPEQGVVSNAWASLGMEAIDANHSNNSSRQENISFEETNSNSEHQPTSTGESDFQDEDDSDVLHIQSPVEVRQDGEAIAEEVDDILIESPNAPPDWKLVEKLSELSQSDSMEEIPHPQLPQAPELSPLPIQVEEEIPTEEIISESQQTPDELEVWNSKQEVVADSEWAVYWR